MKICNAEGNGRCVGCNGTPPKTNGISHGDICRKVVQNIIDCIADGEYYRYIDGKLYRVDIEMSYYEELYDCEVDKIEIS